jgi:hypothetical protein
MADFSPNFVNFTITIAGQEDTRIERRFHRDITIADLKVSRYVTAVLSFPFEFEAVFVTGFLMHDFFLAGLTVECLKLLLILITNIPKYTKIVIP